MIMSQSTKCNDRSGGYVSNSHVEYPITTCMYLLLVFVCGLSTEHIL